MMRAVHSEVGPVSGAWWSSAAGDDAMLRALLDVTGDGLALLDHRGCFLALNPPAVAVLRLITMLVWKLCGVAVDVPGVGVPLTASPMLSRSPARLRASTRAPVTAHELDMTANRPVGTAIAAIATAMVLA